MDEAGFLPYSGESLATGLSDAVRPLLQPAQGRRKWTREENTELTARAVIHSNKLLTEFELQAIQQSVSADAAADAKGADTIIGYALCNPVKPDELLDEIVSPKKFDPVRVNVSFDGTAPNETASPKCDPVRLNVSSDGTVPIFDYVLSDDVVSPATVLTTSPAVGAVNVAAREFDSVLSCARHCFSKATPEMARMFEQDPCVQSC
ncbi:uncharacterized protein [Dysidea avara]|uniref:uncharacterized protein n=1 Tax=Dysidea avara TaxID=196820 RepID=UPI003319A6E2